MTNTRILSLAVTLLLALNATTHGQSQPKLELFDPAPELDVRFVKGEPITLAAGRGEKVYIVEYWATWCAPCKASIPHLTKLQKKYEDEGLVIIGISDETLKKVQEFTARMGDTMGYRVAIDPGGRKTKRKYAEPFDVNSIPWAVVIDKAGRIMWHGHPMDPIVDPLVEALLEEQVDLEPAEPSPPPADQPPVGPPAPKKGEQKKGEQKEGE